MRRAVLVVLSILSNAACDAARDPIRARVDCVGNPNEPVVDCSVQHLSGERLARVCWRLRYECQNLTEVTGGEFCASVDPGRRSNARIPLTRLSHIESCDVPTSSEIRDVRVSAGESTHQTGD
jgi:hypothetical protein